MFLIVGENWCVPSFRATKYRYFTCAGRMAAKMEDSPGLAIGPAEALDVYTCYTGYLFVNPLWLNCH